MSIFRDTLNQLEIDRKSTRLNSSHTDIYTLPLHDALPIFLNERIKEMIQPAWSTTRDKLEANVHFPGHLESARNRSEEHTSELQSHRYLHSSPTRRSSDLPK